MTKKNEYVTVSGEKAHGLRETMLKWFGGLSLVTFSCLLLALILTVVITNGNISSTTEVELEGQIEDQAHAMLKEAGDYFLQVLGKYDRSVVTVLSETATNTLKSGYSMSLVEPNYFDYAPSLLKQPLTQDSRQVDDVSFGASCYYVTGSDTSTVFSADIIRVRNATTNLDPYFKHSYDTNTDVVGVYTGFETSTPLFRHYPGINVSDSRTYNPTERGWYIDAKSNYQNGLSTGFSTPYADAFGKGWMITASIAIRDPTSSYSLIGVAGADILISTISNVLDSIHFLETGKLTLFHSSGQVVSDTEWNPTPSDQNPFSYSDLNSPAVSSDTWTSIHAVPTNSIQTIKFNGYLAYVYHPVDYQGDYYLVIFVRESEIYEPVNDTLDDLDSANTTISVTLTIIVLVVFAFLMMVVLYIISQILEVFAEITHNVDVLLGNVGCTEKDLTDGMVNAGEVSTVELQRMQAGMNAMIASMRATRQNNNTAAATMDNPGFQRMADFNKLVSFSTMPQPEAPAVAYTYGQSPPAVATAVPTAAMEVDKDVVR